MRQIARADRFAIALRSAKHISRSGKGEQKCIKCNYYIIYIIIAHACVSTRANLSARAICRMHEKSYSAEKDLFIEYSSFNPLFMFTSAIFE